MARTNKGLRKTRHVRTAAQKRRDNSRKYCEYRRVWVDAGWPLEAAPHRVLVAMKVDTSGVDPRELDEVEAFDWGKAEEADQPSTIVEPNPRMADWERELLGADLPGQECEDYPLLDPQDEELEWYGDHMLVTDDLPVDGYGMFGGVAVLGNGYGLDAVFGEGYRSGNCGFSVKTRP